VKLPEDIGTVHHIVLIIDQEATRHPPFSTEGIWAGGPDISPEDIAEARR